MRRLIWVVAGLLTSRDPERVAHYERELEAWFLERRETRSRAPEPAPPPTPLAYQCPPPRKRDWLDYLLASEPRWLFALGWRAFWVFAIYAWVSCILYVVWGINLPGP